jgi:dipeptidase E
MKLYLSSIKVPTPDDLSELLGKPLARVSMALLPNAQDYYSKRAEDYRLKTFIAYFQSLDIRVTVVDLREYDDEHSSLLKAELVNHDLVWAVGGNTFCLRYEMKRSGFDTIIRELLGKGIVYGGDSAGALVAGVSIAGIESADIPEFAEAIVTEGMELVPYVVLPHVDNTDFVEVSRTVRDLHMGKIEVIELKDSQAVIFNGVEHRVVEVRV